MGRASFNGFREEHFDFFKAPQAARSSATQVEITTTLDGLWEAIRETLTPAEAAELGVIHHNPLASDDTHAVAQANWEPETRRYERTNLSIELWSHELQVDIVGWTVNQAQLLEAWLAPDGIVGPKDGLDAYELVVWRRHPYNYARKGQDKQARYRPETPNTYAQADKQPLSAIRGERLETLRAKWRRDPDPKWEKLAYHVRRSWSRAQVVRQGAALVPDMAQSIRELIPVVQRISRRR